MADPISSVGGEIDKILFSIADEIEHFTKRISADAKVTAQDIDLFVESLERRDHALNNRLDRSLTQKLNYRIPESLKQRLLKEIFLLEHDRNMRARVEQIMARHTVVWGVLKKIETTIRSERYKIKVDKVERVEAGPEKDREDEKDARDDRDQKDEKD